MFKIYYEILDEEKSRISEIKHISEFENSINTVLGQIKLVFNESVEGFIDKEIPYCGEFLIMWFKLLNDSLLYLNLYGFATIKWIGSDSIWLEFKMEENTIVARKINAERQGQIENFIENTPRNSYEVLWQEDISRDEFYNTIIITSKRFLSDILSLNKIISQSQEYIELERKISDRRK